MKSRETLKYFGGAVCVYVIVAACSGGTRRTAGMRADGGPPDAAQSRGGAEGAPGSDANGSGGAADAWTLTDAVTKPVSDAFAQTSCGQCTTSGALKVVTADTDAQQHFQQVQSLTVPVGGAYGSVAFDKVTSGPIFVTAMTSGSATLYTVTATQSCAVDPAAASDSGSVVAATFPPATTGSHWVNLISPSLGQVLVHSGEKLCVAAYGGSTTTNLTVTVLGYRPY